MVHLMSVWRVGLVVVSVAMIAVVGCGDATDSSPPDSSTTATLNDRPRSVVVDTDLAVDSIMALLYLLGRPEVDIAAVTVSGTGEVTCGPGAEIAAGVIALAGADEIPVACGPDEPLEGANAFPSEWRAAADEAWGLRLPAGDTPSELAAPELIVSTVSESAEPVVVFTDGPLTNLAAAMRIDPGIAERIAMVYAMGGAVDVPGNTVVNPDAEYNIWVDPTAAAEVFASGVPITLVPLDATNQVPLESRHVAALEDHRAVPAVEATLTMLQPDGSFDLYFWDQLTAVILVDESLAEFETIALDVTTEGAPDSVGVTRRSTGDNAIRVAATIDTARFERAFLSGLAGQDVVVMAKPTKQPVGTMDELLGSLLAAADGEDADALATISTEEAMQSTYLVEGGAGVFEEPFRMAEWDPSSDSMRERNVVGEPLVVGDAAALAAGYSLPGEPAAGAEGVVMAAGSRSVDGLLLAGSADFVAIDEPPAEPAVAGELIEALAAAWNADDVDGVLATMSDDVAVWGDVVYPDTTDSGPELRQLLEGAFTLQIEVTGPPLTSGPFAAVPLSVTSEPSDESFDAIATLWIRDGKIALMALAQGGPGG